MVAAHRDQRAVVFARRLEYLQQDPERRVEGLDLAQVVRDVLPHLGHVGQVRRELAAERVGIDPPQRFAGALDPLAVHVGRPKPVAEGPVALAIGQERFEVRADLLEQLPIGRVDRRAGANQRGRVLRKTVKPPPRLFVSVPLRGEPKLHPPNNAR